MSRRDRVLITLNFKHCLQQLIEKGSVSVPSKRTLESNSPLDTVEARRTLASIKRDLRRVRRELQGLQPTKTIEEKPEHPIRWDMNE